MPVTILAVPASCCTILLSTFGDAQMPAVDVVLNQLALAPSILTRMGVPVPARMTAKPFMT